MLFRRAATTLYPRVAQASRGVHGAARAAVAQAPGVREGFLRPSHWGVIGCAVAGLGLFAWQAELAPAHAQAQVRTLWIPAGYFGCHRCWIGMLTRMHVVGITGHRRAGTCFYDTP